jgi:ribosome biogenesis protein BMS1
MGWRRYQTMPVYSNEDVNERERHLKYTPEHMHCSATFYGPLVPPNTSLLAYQKASPKEQGFRICLTGTALELKATPTVVKKLKLVGTPVKIFKNTAFITGMFNSTLEAAKFEGSKIQTVSGIRGQVKKALKDGEPGNFRATFEDKILPSDIVTCRLWVPVDIKKYYNPVQQHNWQGMRTVSEIRREESISQPINKDSLYKPIVRKEKMFQKMSIPKKLQEALPFSSKPKQQARHKENTYLKRRAVITEPEDRKKRALVQTLQLLSKTKAEMRQQHQQLRAKTREKNDKIEARKFEEVDKESKKRMYREKAKDSAKKKQKT